MKKYILILLLGLVCFSVFAQTKKEKEAFDKIVNFLQNYNNYNVPVKRVDFAKTNFTKPFYFYKGNDINLRNKPGEGRILIPPINKKNLLRYPDTLKSVFLSKKKPLFKIERLNELQSILDDKQKIIKLNAENDSIKIENTKLKADNKTLSNDTNLNNYLLYALIAVSIISLILLFFLLRKRTKDLEDKTEEEAQLNKKEIQKINELNQSITKLEAQIRELETINSDLQTKVTTANASIKKLEEKYEKKELNTVKQPQKEEKEQIQGTSFSKTLYAQSPGDKYFTKTSFKYSRGRTPYILRINEEETEGEFYLYESEANYEDALSRDDIVLIYACNIPNEGIDKKTYSKVETPQNGRGKIKKTGDKWEIIKKAEIKLS